MRLANGQVVPLRFRATSSVQGPPYIEIVHVSGPGDHPWKANAHKSPVHIGYAVDDLAAASDALVAAGFPRIITADVPGQSAAIFAYHQGPGDILFELVDKAFLPPGVCDTPGSPFSPVPRLREAGLELPDEISTQHISHRACRQRLRPPSPARPPRHSRLGRVTK